MHRHLDRPSIRLGAFALLFLLSQWPALTQAWWFIDDYARIIELEPPFLRACQNGRPLESLWLMTLRADASGDMVAANIALRSVQALAHVLVAFLGGSWLCAALGQRAAFWAAALFLLWPFHTEAVLWRTAGANAFGALLGTLAMTLAWPVGRTPGRRRFVLAAVVLAAATLTNQTGSLIAWVLPLLASLAGAPLAWRPRRVLLLLAVHAAAAAASYLITRLPEFANARAALAIDPMEKLQLLRCTLARLWLWELYPTPLPAAHIALLVAALLAMPGRLSHWRTASGSTGLLLLACALPFATILTVRESDVPFRVMYLGPWLLVGACLLAGRAPLSGPRWPARVRQVLALAAGAVALPAYIDVGRVSAAEYVELFAAEQRVLATAERLAVEHCTRRVFVEPAAELSDRNPLCLQFVHAAAKLSALQVPWSVRGRIEQFSHLELVSDPAAAAAAAAASNCGVRRPPHDGFAVEFDGATRTVLILQPRLR